MNLLIIGGSRFVGRAIVEAALAADHRVTLFNRGRSNPELFPDVEKIVGDRNHDVDLLAGRTWDAVIDTSGYKPEQVRLAAETLKEATDHYTFISTISTYADFSQPGIDEQSPQQRLIKSADGDGDGVLNSDNYGALKTECEIVLEAVLPAQVLHVRPALIVGPHDPQDLFPYLIFRAAQGGEMLVPGRPDSPMQFIDARDLAAWVIAATVEKRKGAYITTGPDYRLTMGEILETARRIAQADTTFTYVGDHFLLDQGLTPNDETPWWIPQSHIGYGCFNNTKAVAAGLSFRPLADTVRDTHDWLSTRTWGPEWQSGLSQEKEAALLDTWHAQPDPDRS